MNFKQFVYTFNDAFYYKILEVNLAGCASVLDVGCGSNSPLRYVKKIFYSEGIDIYKPSIDKAKKSKIHDTYKIGDIIELDKYYKPKSFDTVIALDVIEHLEKRVALQLLEKMKTIAQKKIIVLTPNGFYHQGHFENNPYQVHKSAWFTQDLEKLGYRVYGLRGFKKIRGELARIKYKPWILWGFIAFITEPILYYFPNLSYHLFAIKTLNNETGKKQ